MIAVGMMSGTSIDGIELAAISIDDGPRPTVRVLATAHRDYSGPLRERLLDAASGKPLSTHELAALHADLGDAYADAASAFVAGVRPAPELIALHGQTVAHLPRRATLQLGDAARVALRCGIVTIADFRSADVAAGGEGAPLVPFADLVLFGDRAPVAMLNLGGIANLTLIPTHSAGEVIAFDTGPANMLSDLIAGRLGERFDRDGARAARGKVNAHALARALGDPYFARRAPKSTGREDFGAPFADRLLDDVTRGGGSLEDALATAVELTARSVALALARETPSSVRWRELIVAGGGARNATLMRRLRDAAAPIPVRTTDELGIPSASREAISFAVLGVYRMRGLPNTLPSATGASRAVSGGAIHRPV